MNRKALFVAGALLFALPVGARQPLTLKITPALAPAPAYLTVHATVDEDSDNRGIEVAVQSADYYTSSWVDLDGNRAPRTTIFQFKSLPSGTYDVTATLMGGNGPRGVASTWFRSVSTPGEQ